MHITYNYASEIACVIGGQGYTTVFFSKQAKKTNFNQEDWQHVMQNTGVILTPITLFATSSAYVMNLKLRGEVVLFDVLLAFALCLILGLPTISAIMIRNRQLYLICKEMEVLATTDSLTCTLNRRAFNQKSDTFLSQRSDESFPNPVSFLAIDVDKFKSVNDQFGHQIGDKALVLISKTIALHVRETDFFGRLGGEEFGVLLPNTSPEAALALAEGMRQAVSAIHFSPKGQIRPLSISVGASSTTRNTDFSALYKRADEKLFEAKTNGRNNVKACQGAILPMPQLTSNLLH